jgi:pimeloyl-ACP methyl ester carboxylesterase
MEPQTPPSPPVAVPLRGPWLSLKAKLIVAAVLVVVLAIGGYAGVTWYVYSRQDVLVFPRAVKAVKPVTKVQNPNMQVQTLITGDGIALRGLLLPPLPDANGPQPSMTLVMAFAGNADDVTGMVDFLKNRVFRNDNVAVAGFSYRGYSNALHQPSDGAPTEANVEGDAVLEYDNLVARLHPARVQVVGYSLGTAVGTYLAMNRKVDSLVLIAPFSSMTAVAKAQYPWLPVDALLHYRFKTDQRLGVLAARKVRPEVAVFYSESDGLIPAVQPKLLASLYPSATLVELPGAAHGAMLGHPDLPGGLREVMK